MHTRERPRFAPSRRSLAGMLAAAVALPAVAVAAPSRGSEPDAALVALVDELDSLDAQGNALGAAHPGTDYDDIPGTQAIEDRRWDVLDAIAATPATSMKGFAAKARALLTEGVQGDAESHEAIADSLAADLLAASA